VHPCWGPCPDLRLPLTSEGQSKHSTSVQPLVSGCLKVTHLEPRVRVTARLFHGPVEGTLHRLEHGCSPETKRRLLLGRKAITNLDNILKRRDITLPTKVHLVKALVFPIVMYGCESWTIKKAKHRRIDAFELWCWRRFLRVPWTARRLNQSILKEISPEYSLEGLKLKLKLQYCGHMMGRTDSLEKTLMLRKI